MKYTSLFETIKSKRHKQISDDMKPVSLGPYSTPSPTRV